MTAQPITLLAVFIARCEARAILCGLGELELQEAVDVLQIEAVASGLVGAIGQDEIQAVMVAAFEAVRHDLG